MNTIRIAMLHLAPVVADVAHNRRLAEQGLAVAAAGGAQWVITPELFITGYKFAEVIGTEWILPQPDEWMQGFCRQAGAAGVTVFLSHPEREPEGGLMYNTVFVIGPDGDIIGRHRKVKALRGPEAWSSPGAEIAPVEVPLPGGGVCRWALLSVRMPTGTMWPGGCGNGGRGCWYRRHRGGRGTAGRWGSGSSGRWTPGCR